ncbi:MAG: Ig-like domain-containing protein, partial [Blautia sp.]|nr:Ig-like domain-containing protein [Blautia sp.]
TAIKGLPKTLELQVGEENTLKPSLSPITCVQKKTYKSSNTKVVTVTSKGVLKAKKVGTAKITVQAGKKKYVIQVTVKAKTAE